MKEVKQQKARDKRLARIISSFPPFVQSSLVHLVIFDRERKDRKRDMLRFYCKTNGRKESVCCVRACSLCMCVV